MQFHYAHTWHKKAYCFPYITKERHRISEDLVSVNICRSRSFEKRIFEHENKDLVGSRTRIKCTAIIYFSMLGNNIA